MHKHRSLWSARTAGVMSFSAAMIFLSLGGGRWFFPTQAKYIPAALLGFAMASVLWGIGLMASGRSGQRWYLALYPLLSVTIFVLVRIFVDDGISWFVAGATMAMTVAVFGVGMLLRNR